MKENDYKSKFKTSAEVLKSLFDEKKGGVVSEQFLRWKLWMMWNDVVGPTTAEVTEPVAYHNGILWVWVKNSTWMQQMSFMTETLKNTIDKKFRKDYVKEIRYTLDRRSLPGRFDPQFQQDVKKFLK